MLSLHGEFDFRPTGAQKVPYGLLGPVIRREVPKQFAALRAFCEG
jgi:hypothetical protein